MFLIDNKELSYFPERIKEHLLTRDYGCNWVTNSRVSFESPVWVQVQAWITEPELSHDAWGSSLCQSAESPLFELESESRVPSDQDQVKVQVTKFELNSDTREVKKGGGEICESKVSGRCMHASELQL